MIKANKRDLDVLKAQGFEGLHRLFEQDLWASRRWKDLTEDFAFRAYKEGCSYKQEMKSIREEIREHIRSLVDFPESSFLSDLNPLMKRYRDRYNATVREMEG